MEFRSKKSSVMSGIFMVLLGLAMILGISLWFSFKSYQSQDYLDRFLDKTYFALILIGLISLVIGIYTYISSNRMKIVITNDRIYYFGGLSRFDKAVSLGDITSVSTFKYKGGISTIIRWKCHIPDCPGCSKDRIVLTPEFDNYIFLISKVIDSVPESIVDEGSKKYVKDQDIEEEANSREDEFKQLIAKHTASIPYRLMMAINILALPIMLIWLINKELVIEADDYLLTLYTVNMLIAVIYYYTFERVHSKVGGRAYKALNAINNKVILSSIASTGIILYVTSLYQ